MRERLYLSLLMGILLCLVGWTAHAQLSRPTRLNWEYTYSRCGAQELNAAGAQGWELVTITTGSVEYCVMKRTK